MATETANRPMRKLAQAVSRCRRGIGITAAVSGAGLYLATAGWVARLGLAGAVGALLAVPQTRRWLLGYPSRARARMQLAAGLKAVSNAVGSLKDVPPPRVSKVRTTPVGVSAELRCRPGHTGELFTNLSTILRSTCRCRSVLVDRDADDGGRIYLDIIRRDAFAAGQLVPWAGLAASDLSMWDGVHVGIDESSQPVHLPLAYRGVILGGVMDSGKSSLLTNLVAHAAMSGAHLVLIDPNRVQFGPWRHRALAYAEADPDEAIAAVEALAGEMGARLDLLQSLPGVVRKIDRQVAEEHNLHPILFAIDELAYHTATVGTPQQRTHFANLCRDVVSRGRAVLVVPVMATQRPTQDVVPRALVDLFPYQVAFRVRNAANSDVILGDGRAKAGFDASEISPDTPGVAYLQASTGQTETTGRRKRAGQDRPRRFKGCWIPDEAIAELAGASLPFKPAAPSGWSLGVQGRVTA